MGKTRPAWGETDQGHVVQRDPVCSARRLRGGTGVQLGWLLRKAQGEVWSPWKTPQGARWPSPPSLHTEPSLWQIARGRTQAHTGAWLDRRLGNEGLTAVQV